MAARTPDLNRKLAHTIKPTGGPAAQLETLAHAAQLIADLDLTFKLTRAFWLSITRDYRISAERPFKCAEECIFVQYKVPMFVLEVENKMKMNRKLKITLGVALAMSAIAAISAVVHYVDPTLALAEVIDTDRYVQDLWARGIW